MSSSITLGSNTYTLVTIPTNPGVADFSLTMFDAVATVQSPFVPSQVQTQAWPGADGWSLEFTLPKMAPWVASQWRGFMAELRGMQNVFQFGDPLNTTPMGQANGSPIAATTVGTNNAIGSTSLVTSGWSPNVFGQLMPGDYIQIGYRLYVVCEQVNSDGEGNATISIFPSLRDQPAFGALLTLANTKGVFRLAQNNRAWHADFSRNAQVSFKATEAR